MRNVIRVIAVAVFEATKCLGSSRLAAVRTMALPPSIDSTSKLDAAELPPKAKKLKKSKKGKEKAADQNLEVNGVHPELRGHEDDGADSNFKLVQVLMRIPLAPVFAEDPLEGVRQCLESWVLR